MWRSSLASKILIHKQSEALLICIFQFSTGIMCCRRIRKIKVQWDVMISDSLNLFQGRPLSVGEQAESGKGEGDRRAGGLPPHPCWSCSSERPFRGPRTLQRPAHLSAKLAKKGSSDPSRATLLPSSRVGQNPDS